MIVGRIIMRLDLAMYTGGMFQVVSVGEGLLFFMGCHPF